MLAASVLLAPLPALAYPSLTFPAFQERFRKSKGRWQLIVIWSSWCTTCEEDFGPVSRMLIDRWKSEPFDVWTMVLDDTDTEKDAAALLKRSGADWETYRPAAGVDYEKIFQFIDGRWRGDVPHLVLFNPKGEVALIRNGRINAKQLDHVLTRVTGRKARAIRAEDERKLKEAREAEARKEAGEKR